jgi:hypothetical protein
MFGVRDSTQRSVGSLSWEQWLQQLQSPLSTWGNAQPDIEEVIRNLGGPIKANGPVFSLVAARAMVFSEARFLWRRFENGRPQDLFSTAELSLLDRPWPGGTTANLLARIEFDVSSAGNAYVRRLRDEDRLTLLRPEWVQIVLASNEDADHPNEAGDVIVFGYIYDPPNSDPVLLLPDEVAHIAPIPDPDYRFLGMSWISPVLREIHGDSAGIEHKNSFFQNAATPQIILKFPEKMKADKVEEYGKLIDARHQGVENSYKIMYLGGGADPMVVGKDFREMDFTRLQGRAESRLASAAGVPPSWVGFAEGLQGSALNQGNFTAARRRFADGTVRPYWREVAGSLEVLLSRPGGENSSAQLWYDDRDIPFLREDKQVAATIQAEEAATIMKLVREGFIWESVLEAVKKHDWDLLEFDERFVSVQLQAVAGAKTQLTEVKEVDDSSSDD